MRSRGESREWRKGDFNCADPSPPLSLSLSVVLVITWDLTSPRRRKGKKRERNNKDRCSAGLALCTVCGKGGKKLVREIVFLEGKIRKFCKILYDIHVSCVSSSTQCGSAKASAEEMPICHWQARGFVERRLGKLKVPPLSAYLPA